MTSQASITASRSFQSRLLDAERSRLAMMAGCMLIVLMLWVTRRALGGVVASEDALFGQVSGVLGLGILLTAASFWDVVRRARTGAGLPTIRAAAGVVVDLGVPFACLLAMQLQSPRGAYVALSGPTLMLVPIVVMLSVLRLRPAFALAVGLVAACLHWALAARAIQAESLPRSTWPAVLSYGVLLAFMGVGAAVLAGLVRGYIREAVREAEEAERAERALRDVQFELSVARTIQMGLLPTRAPDLAGFELAGMARPATEAGGDYYDWQELPDGRVVLAIADVTGHGIGPALVMAVCRAYARATAPRSTGAKELLERVNTLIAEDIKGQRFITMAVALLGPGGDLELLSAGHGPTYIYRGATGGVEEYGGNGLPLGVRGDETFDHPARLRLDPGDALVLLTDGFMEQSGPGGQLFGRARLREIIRARGGLDAQALLREIDGAVTAYAGDSAQEDDQTLVVVKRT